MAFTYGFYNSKNKDRRYNADQMSQLFDGILNDGVFNKVGELMMVVPGTGLQVLVKSGRAWFNSTWSYNDAAYPLNLSTPDVTVPRIDAVVLEVDHTETVRRNRLLVVKGIASSNPEKPTLTNTDLIHQHPLAYVKLQPGAQSISAGDIEIMVGKDECPFVTGILETASLEDLYEDWDNQFTTWFEDIQSQLEGDVATNLLNEINKRVKIADKANQEEAQELDNDTKWMTPLMTKYAVSKHPDLGKISIGGSLFNVNFFPKLNLIKTFIGGTPYVSPNKKYILFVSSSSFSLRTLPDLNQIYTQSGNSITDAYLTDTHFIILTNGNKLANVYSYNAQGGTEIAKDITIPLNSSVVSSYLGSRIFCPANINRFFVTDGTKFAYIDLNTGLTGTNKASVPSSNNIYISQYDVDSFGNFYFSYGAYTNGNIAGQQYSYIYKITQENKITIIVRNIEGGVSSEGASFSQRRKICIVGDKLYSFGPKSDTYIFERYSLDGAKEYSTTVSMPTTSTLTDKMIRGKNGEQWFTNLRKPNLDNGKLNSAYTGYDYYIKNNLKVEASTRALYFSGGAYKTCPPDFQIDGLNIGISYSFIEDPSGKILLG